MKTNPNISRREMLKLLAAGAGAAYFPGWGSLSQPVPRFLEYARVFASGTRVYAEPSTAAPAAAVYPQDAVLPVQATFSDDVTGHGSWYQISNVGYLPITAAQPVVYDLQPPNDQISSRGSLAEVRVPYTTAYYSPTTDSQALYRYYFSTTHWVTKLVYDRNGRAWYRVRDDKFPESPYWVPSNHLRVFPEDELTPLSPDVPIEDKFIRVDLGEQSVTAYEYGQAVFNTTISSGDTAANPKYQTPTGSFRVGLKRASQHMLPWDQTFGDYDLPGVPWISYFTAQAHAFHGAYWHNGFGHPRSHGCVNLRPEDARWIFRWTTPVVPGHTELIYSEDRGTRLEVVEGEKR